MADIVLSPMLQVVFDRLASPILQKFGELFDLEDNFKNLQQALLMAQAVLEDAEAHQVTNRAIKVWLSELKDAVYNAEDVLDRALALLAGHQIVEQNSVNLKSRGSLFFAGFATEVNTALHELERIALHASNFNLRRANMVAVQPNIRETASYVTESKIYGREADKEILVKLLLSKEENECFISIIGIGGIGKTTLAQLAYNDDEVTRQFDFKVWVFVSDDFDAKRIIRAIIESVTMDKFEALAMDVLQLKLRHLLHKKRYLIVLDDVWTEDAAEWDKLELLTDIGIEGSKVLITTRSEKVASIMSSPPFRHYLKGLAEDGCWKLFKSRAFMKGEENMYPNLQQIGKVIIQKCGGIPLAAKQLGSAMRFKRKELEWLYVQNSEIWNMDVGETGILPVLRLSYLHLPYHLRRCFEFCSVFPKRYEITKERLIQKWMAQGLIQQSNGSSKQLEDVGDEYFQHLVWASFFEDLGVSEKDGTKIYRMHDLMHDLAQSLVGEESLTLERGLPSGNLSRTRHLYIIREFSTRQIPKALCKARHLRTLIGVDIAELPSKLTEHFPFLRLLDLTASSSRALQDWFHSEFLCLRYLDLSYTSITFGDSIGEVPFLQTLNLSHCYNLLVLPRLINMTALRHLNITACEALTTMLPFPARAEYFSSLVSTSMEHIILKYLPKPNNPIQTLSTVYVRSVLDLLFLEFLDLRGKLKIKRLHNVTRSDEAKRANLERKDKLELLELHWGYRAENGIQKPSSQSSLQLSPYKRGEQQHSSGSSQRQTEPDLAEEIITNLHPHKNLKILVVQGYPGRRFPHWKLPNLNKVNLISCERCESLPTLGHLLFLKNLYLQEFPAVTFIGKEFYGEDNQRQFPSLHDLVIEDFANLQDWVDVHGGDVFPNLMKLIVKKCPKLASMPTFPSLQHLELRDCNAALFHSIRGLSTLNTLVIEKVVGLFSLPERLFSNNSLLTSLEIISCPNLQCLPPELVTLPVLKSLKIRWCSELSFLPQDLQNLKALESLEITDCHSLTSMPEDGIGGLSSLRSMSIENCSSLSSMSDSFQNLSRLEHLTVMYCPSLVSFPEDMHHLSALRSLTIMSCPQISSFPEGLQNVTTLLVLEISGCPDLTVLPEWIGNMASLRSLIICDCGGLTQLPEALKLLTGLQHLSIQGCQEIEQRCKTEVGEDWPKIAHVPHKYIGVSTASQHGAASSSST